MNNRIFLKLIILAVFAYVAIFVAPAILNHKVKQAAEAEAENKSSSDEFDDFESSSEPHVIVPSMTPEEIAKHGSEVAQIELKIIQLARGNSADAKKAIDKTTRFYAALNHKTAWFHQFARPARDKFRDELPGSDVASIAEEAVIIHSFKTRGASKKLAADLTAFANGYDGDRPVNLIRRISNELVTQNKPTHAVKLLELTQAGLREAKDLLPIQQHLLLTQRTAFNTSTSPVSVGRDSSPLKQRSTGRLSDLVGNSYDISGRTIDGRSVSTYSMRGSYVVVHFWATWCGACVNKMPKFVSESKELRRVGVQYVGVCLDTDKKKLSKFLSKQKIDWPQIVHLGGNRGWDHPMVKKLGVTSIPVNIILGPDGRVIATDVSPKFLKEVVSY